MRDTIETLCSIDTRASQIIENGAAQKKALAREFDEKARIAAEKIKADSQARMKELASQLDEVNAQEIARLSTQARENLARLDENYKTNHDQFVQEIFSRITGA